MLAKELNVISTERTASASRSMHISPTSATDGLIPATNEALKKIKESGEVTVREIYEYKDSCVDELQEETLGKIEEIKTTPGVIKNENGNLIQFWTGSQLEYDAINPKNPETMYFIKGF
ncbi:MAG: phage upper tail fiber protein [Fusobacteriaceae bacterium]